MLGHLYSHITEFFTIVFTFSALTLLLEGRPFLCVVLLQQFPKVSFVCFGLTLNNSSKY